MSDALEPDLIQYLEVRRSELETSLHSSRNQVLANASMKGTVQSGGTLQAGVAAMEGVFRDYIIDLAGVIDRWVGEHLPEARVREIVADHLRRSVEDLATADTACGAPGRGIRGSALNAINGLVGQTKTRMLTRIREFELGADRAKPGAPSIVNIVHANNIIGGVVQAGGDAMQANTVQLSAEAIGASLNHLLELVAATAPDLKAQIEPDAATIRAQLTKAEPSSTIVQEAGRTIRAVVEGAAGGAVGAVMTPGLVQALAAFSAAIGSG